MNYIHNSKNEGRLKFRGLTLYPVCCLTRDKGCGNSLVGLVGKCHTHTMHIQNSENQYSTLRKTRTLQFRKITLPYKTYVHGIVKNI